MRRGSLTTTKFLLVGLFILVALIILHFNHDKSNTRTESDVTKLIDKYGTSHGIMSEFFSGGTNHGQVIKKQRVQSLPESKSHVQSLPESKSVEKVIPKEEQAPLMDKKEERLKDGENGKQLTKEEIVSTLPKHFITVDFKGRLGNVLFQYAALFGIAKKNNLMPLVSKRNELHRIFALSAKTTEENYVHYERKYAEKRGCAFEPEVMGLGSDKNVKLDGYFQSFKYFKENEEALHKEFQFQKNLLNAAEVEFSELVASKSGKGSGSTTYVAIHIRRGDMVHSKHMVDYGYISPDISYFKKGMDMFRAKYSNCLFVVASDDTEWSKEALKGDDTVFIKPGNTRELDMAIMTRCNHTLMSVGSFGWWTAWIINGTTVYFKGYPRPNSQLANQIVLEDYRPPHWIGIE